MSYKIGYRRPPKDGQFKPGKSGNPKGRPKGSKNFMILLDKELGQSIVVNENGRKKKVSRLQAMVKRLVADALQGDKKSLTVLFDIIRRSETLASPDAGSLLPAGYEAILENYVQRRHRTDQASTQPQSEACDGDQS